MEIIVAITMRKILVIFALLGSVQTVSHANSIEWGDQVFHNDRTSSGALINSTFKFELGTFGNTDLASTPLSDWRLNWKLLDTTGYNDTTKHFSDTATINFNMGDTSWSPDAGNFPPPAPTPVPHLDEGEQVYIWIYNNLNRDATTEWGIFTRIGGTAEHPAWVLPKGPSSHSVLPQTMFISEVDYAPFGGVPGSQNGGTYTPQGNFAFQTHSFGSSIPEPASEYLLGGLGMLVLVNRRRRI